MQKVVFLDRDGVISRDDLVHVTSWEEFCFLPHAKKGIKLLNDHGFHLIIITNQSAIGRGLTTKEKIEHIHEKMFDEIRKSGGNIEKIYYCPHHPDEGCSCRKPKPGLLYQAIQENNIDATRSFMVGDRMKDVEVGKAVACKTILIRSERGVKELRQSTIQPEYIAQDLLDAGKWIIQTYKTL
jgi:histidinol-phosphate phosphatase family protein